MAGFDPDAYLAMPAQGFNPDAYLAQPAAPSVGIDVAKQIGSGLVTGTESIPAAVPSMLGSIGHGVQSLIDKYAPGLTDKSAVARQGELRDLIAAQRNGGIAQYLPKPQTTAGEYARTAAEFVPSSAGLSGSVARNVIGGVTAGLASEGAGQATKGTAAEPYARIFGALGGGVTGLRASENIANRVAARGVPEGAVIKQGAQDIYSGLTERHTAIPIPESELSNVAGDIRATLNKTGPRPSVAKEIHSAIDEIERPATKGAADVADLVAARQNIKMLLNSPDANSAGAAKALPKIDAAIERLSPGTMQKLRTADKDWAAFKADEAVNKKINRAELRASGADSGLNLGNKIRQKVADYLLSNESQPLSPQNRAALEHVVRGTLGQNVMRAAANAMGGGGGIGSTLIGLGSAAGGSYSGHPELSLMPIGGIGLRMLANRSVARQAANAGAMIRARAPSSQAAGIVGPAPRLTRQEAGLLAALYAKPALRGLLPIEEPQR